MKDYEGIDHVKKIWILEQVVRNKSLKEAALRAKVTPSAVSQAVSALEEVVGKPLLIRGSNGVEPTEAALEMVRAASPALQTLSDLAKTTQSHVPAMTWLSLGTYESLGITLLGSLISSLETQLPGAKLTVRIGRTATLAGMVRKGELCAALVPESDCFGRLVVTDLAKERLGLYGSGRKISGLRVGGLAAGTDGFPRYYQKFVEQRLGPELKPTILSDSFETLRSAAVQGSILAVLPERVAMRNPGELEEIELPKRKSSPQGEHRICLISLPSCDQDEVRFLAQELGGQLKSAGYSIIKQ